MPSDIRLEEDSVVIDAFTLKHEGGDFQISYAKRRQPLARSAHRRALVHGESDELVVNLEQDYPGGVTLRGPVLIQDKVRLELDHFEFEFKPAGPAAKAAAPGLAMTVREGLPGLAEAHAAVVPDVGLMVDTRSPAAQHLRTVNARLKRAAGKDRVKVDMGALVVALVAEVAALRATVDELQGRHG